MQETNTPTQSNWLSFWKNNLIYCVIGFISFICFLIIFFVLNDYVYLYISITVPILMILWIGLDAIRWYLKLKKNQQEQESEPNA